MSTRGRARLPGTPCWADLGAGNVGAARVFYSGLLGWSIPAGRPEQGGYSMCQVAGRAVAGIGPRTGGPEGPGAWTT
jgi:predicted enzyme related to lactoylglutathione lyase